MQNKSESVIFIIYFYALLSTMRHKYEVFSDVLYHSSGLVPVLLRHILKSSYLCNCQLFLSSVYNMSN